MCLIFIPRPAPTGARNRGYRRWFRQEPAAYPGGIGYPLEACRIFSTRSGLCTATEPFYCRMKTFPQFHGRPVQKLSLLVNCLSKPGLSALSLTVAIALWMKLLGLSSPGIFAAYLSGKPAAPAPESFHHLSPFLLLSNAPLGLQKIP